MTPRPFSLCCILFYIFAIGVSSLSAQIEAEEAGASSANEGGTQPVEKSCALEGTLIINEVGDYTDSKVKKYGEFIELVAVGEKPGFPINLTGFIIDDNHSSDGANGGTKGHIRLGSCFSEIMPGTIILLYDNINVSPGINPLNDGAPNAQGVYQIPFNHPCLTLVNACPFGANTNYFCPSGGYGNAQDKWGRYLQLNDDIDVVQVRNSKFQLEHAVMWWPTTGSGVHYPDENSSKAVKVSGSSVSNVSISFVDSNPYNTNNYNLSPFLTPGSGVVA